MVPEPALAAPGTGGHHGQVTIARLAITICRHCLGEPPGEYAPCWHCRGAVIQVAPDEASADVIIRAEWTGTDIRLVCDLTPACRAWLDEVPEE